MAGVGPWRRLLYRWDRRNQAWADRRAESSGPALPGWLVTTVWVLWVAFSASATARYLGDERWLLAGVFGLWTATLLALGIATLVGIARQRTAVRDVGLALPEEPPSGA